LSSLAGLMSCCCCCCCCNPIYPTHISPAVHHWVLCLHSQICCWWSTTCLPSRWADELLLLCTTRCYGYTVTGK
jgi:hypothetical protein